MSTINSGNWNQTPYEFLRPGIERVVFGMEIDGVSCTIGRVQSGHEVKPHSHPQDQIALVVSGECDYYVDGVCYHLTAGGWVTVPGGVTHYIHVHDTDEPCMQMDIFTPNRPEYKADFTKFLESQGK